MSLNDVNLPEQQRKLKNVFNAYGTNTYVEDQK
jgi:hypothetical protein